MVRRDALRQLGGFDEAFFLYLSDTDLSLRMLQHGWRLAHTPEARVVHWAGSSSRKRRVFAVIDFHRMRLYFYRKHFGAFASACLAVAGGLEAAVLLPVWLLGSLLRRGRNIAMRDQLSMWVQLCRLYAHAATHHDVPAYRTTVEPL